MTSGLNEARAAPVATTAPMAEPLWAVLGIVAGTAGAVLLQPQDYEGGDAMQLPALVMSAGMLLGPAVAFLQRQDAWLRSQNLLMLGLVYWLLTELLQGAGDLHGVSGSAVRQTFVMAGCYASAIWVASWLTSARSTARLRGGAEADLPTAAQLFGLILICGALGMLTYLIPCRFSLVCVADGLTGSRFDSAWNYGPFGGGHSFVHHLRYFGFLLAPLTVMLAANDRRATVRVIVAVVLTLLFCAFIVRGGGRRLVGMILGSAMLTWVLLQPRIALPQLLKIAGFSLLLLVLLQVMLVYRSTGVLQAFQQDRPLRLSDRSGLLRVDYNFRNLGRLVDAVPARHPHTGSQPLIYAFARPVPRLLWPDKPVDQGVHLSSLLGFQARRNHTVTVTQMGDWYLMAGLPTVIIGGLLMGFLAQRANRLLDGGLGMRRFAYALAIMALFISLRALHELIVMGYPLLCLLGLEWLRRRYYPSRHTET